MKLVVQRVKSASVSINDELINKISNGLLLFVGFTHTDIEENLDKMVEKVTSLRIFSDEDGNMNKNIKEVDGEILSISQFTLYANTKKGNRPSFIDAMKYDEAKKLYEKFNEKLKQKIKTKTGVFGEDMLINLENDGPVTIILE